MVHQNVKYIEYLKDIFKWALESFIRILLQFVLSTITLLSLTFSSITDSFGNQFRPVGKDYQSDGLVVGPTMGLLCIKGKKVSGWLSYEKLVTKKP